MRCHIVLTDQWPPENLTVTLGRTDRPDRSRRSTFGSYGTLCSILAFRRSLFRERAPAQPSDAAPGAAGPNCVTGDQQPRSKTRCIASPGPQKMSRARDAAYEMMKLGLDGIEIRKNIRVIKLDIVDHQGLGPVMDELVSLV